MSEREDVNTPSESEIQEAAARVCHGGMAFLRGDVVEAVREGIRIARRSTPPTEAALVEARREGAQRALDAFVQEFVGGGEAFAYSGVQWAIGCRTFRDAYLAATYPPAAPREVVLPKLTWHDAGYNKRNLADETGLIVGRVYDGTAYVGGKAIGTYINDSRAMDAVMKAALASAQERGT